VILALVYGGLMIADAYLLQKFARRGIQDEEEETEDLAVL